MLSDLATVAVLMVRVVHGNIFDSRAEALVNPVNCSGVVGKGLATEFKTRWPENSARYESRCEMGRIEPGDMFVTKYPGETPAWIVNFPTRDHWREPSRIEWIGGGLLALRRVVVMERIRSIAIPALGCGYGGLIWAVVRREIENVMDSMLDVDVELHGPWYPH